MSDVFVSYSRQDREFVNRLVGDLERAGLTVFFDRRVQPGESWAETLAGAIESARFLLVALSPEAVESPWIKHETMVGIEREQDGKTTVIPLMVRPCSPPTYLAIKTLADFTESYEAGLKRLLPVLNESVRPDETGQQPGSLAMNVGTEQLERVRDEAKSAAAIFESVSRRPKTSLPTTRASGRAKCFVVMPFGDDELQVVFEDFVKPVIEEECDLECERGDDVFGSGVVMDDILSSINGADFILADLTGKNANVFYEVGICHAMDKPVLLIAQSMEDVPFDLRHRRILLYDYSPRGCKKLEGQLPKNIRATLSKIS